MSVNIASLSSITAINAIMGMLSNFIYSEALFSKLLKMTVCCAQVESRYL